ncbi:hypothetical protein NDU88_000074 [Pleurodeles waltl]|uniref:Uncharacterized protein n=1 Tax=Pleurodeles waltl TaxID=8319 RepID=A0AAV7KLH1_PLEWA|nr:hypothetical protein NDU88_000074 [Pleurodeles waltl]
MYTASAPRFLCRMEALATGTAYMQMEVQEARAVFRDQSQDQTCYWQERIDVKEVPQVSIEASSINVDKNTIDAQISFDNEEPIIYVAAMTLAVEIQIVVGTLTKFEVHTDIEAPMTKRQAGRC